MKKKKVLVSGCFDLLHPGHIAFFKTAASFGALYVSVGSDHNLLALKGKKPYFNQHERLYLIKSLRDVEDAFIASGSGLLDFEPDIDRVSPDIFIVNTDGHTAEKEALCKRHRIEYLVLERIPEPGLPARSSSATKKELRFPYRLCLAGGWMDQPWVSEIYPGSVVVAQIWPTMDFNDRSGLATSSRKVGIELWGNRYPEGDPGRNARLLFGAENPPGKEYISGSQDHIGLLYPGINRLYYAGGYWPVKIDSIREKETCEWLSDVLHLVPLEPRPDGYDPLKIKHLDKQLVRKLGEAGNLCWEAICNKDIYSLGKAMTDTFLSWSKILPYTVPDWIMDLMKEKYFKSGYGAITSGSGGGYVIVVSEDEVKGSLKIKVRC
jgi:cytidyltransferase-like protein